MLPRAFATRNRPNNRKKFVKIVHCNNFMILVKCEASNSNKKGIPMPSLTRQMLKAAVASCANVFDAHDAERAARTLYPEEFAADLASYNDCCDPVHVFSSVFGRRLTCLGLERDSRVVSENLRSRMSQNQRWRKPALGPGNGAKES
jgi:hypothetical protein